MALYTVVTGNTALAADLNQVVNLLNGSTTGTDVVIGSRIRAQMTGATTATGYVGGNSGAPTSGTFQVGDFIADSANATFWICTTAGTPGVWSRAGFALDSTAGDIQPLAASAAAGSVGKAADAGHVHAYTGLGVLAVAQTWNALQTFSQGAALGTSPTANSSADTTGNTWTGTAYRLAIGYNGQCRQLFTAATRSDTHAVEGDILYNV